CQQRAKLLTVIDVRQVPDLFPSGDDESLGERDPLPLAPASGANHPRVHVASLPPGDHLCRLLIVVVTVATEQTWQRAAGLYPAGERGRPPPPYAGRVSLAKGCGAPSEGTAVEFTAAGKSATSSVF